MTRSPTSGRSAPICSSRCSRSVRGRAAARSIAENSPSPEWPPVSEPLSPLARLRIGAEIATGAVALGTRGGLPLLRRTRG